tara:strand:- start:865 stop:1050 length:186 start_codon:yes stop_codon:yes gene_type:complete
MINDIEFNDKLSAVVCSCKTLAQLNVALAYAKQARKNNTIGDNRYFFTFGTITALKGVLSK